MNNNIILFMVALVLVGWFAYSNALDNPFVLEDHHFIQSTIKKPANAWEFFAIANKESAFYGPMLRIAMSLAQSSFYNNPAQFHALNLFLLMFTAFTGFVLIYTLTNRFLLASLTAVLYVLHPINSIFVNYSSTINMLLLNSFIFLSCICLISRGVQYRILAPIFFILALLCHESAMMFVLFGSTLLITQNREWPIMQRLSPIWPSVMVLTLYGIWRLFFSNLDHVLNNYSYFNMSFAQYVSGLVNLFSWFLNKLIWPSGIVVTWGTNPLESNSKLIFVLLGAFILLIISFRFLIHKVVFFLGMSWILLGFVLIAFAGLAKPAAFLIIEPTWMGMSVFGFCLLLAACVTSIPAWIGLACLLSFWIKTDRVYNLMWYDEKIYCYYWQGQFPEYKYINVYLSKAYEIEGDAVMAKFHKQEALKTP